MILSRATLKPGEGRYGVALFLLLSSTILLMALPSGTATDTFGLLFEAYALIACMRAAETSGVLIRVAITIVVIAVAGLVLNFLVGGIVPQDPQNLLIRMTTIFLVLFGLPSITIGLGRQLGEAGKITIEAVLGALCVYLLLMIGFASAYGVVGNFGNEPFFVQGPSWGTYGDYLYFSGTTITTLGIGDLSPATGVGRSLTAAEALIGQIYLVTVVALIVGNLGRKAPKRTNPDA